MTDKKRSRVLGMILGSVSRGHFPHREPVAFLYGHVAKDGETPTHIINGVGYVGVVAPELPERDREAYPYITITTYNNIPYYAYATPDKCYVLDFKTGLYSAFSDGDALRAKLDKDIGIWKPAYDSEATEEGWTESDARLDEDLEYNGKPITPIVWSNHDIYMFEYETGATYEDESKGTLYLAASDPIPLYE